MEQTEIFFVFVRDNIDKEILVIVDKYSKNSFLCGGRNPESYSRLASKKIGAVIHKDFFELILTHIEPIKLQRKTFYVCLVPKDSFISSIDQINVEFGAFKWITIDHYIESCDSVNNKLIDALANPKPFDFAPERFVLLKPLSRKFNTRLNAKNMNQYVSIYDSAGILFIRQQQQVEILVGLASFNGENEAKIIGGKREITDNNDPLITASREFVEETGIQISINDLAHLIERSTVFWLGPGSYLLYCVVLSEDTEFIRNIDVSFIRTDEIDHLKWVPIDAVSHFLDQNRSFFLRSVFRQHNKNPLISFLNTIQPPLPPIVIQKSTSE